MTTIKLHAPLIIGPTLLPTLRIGETFVSFDPSNDTFDIPGVGVVSDIHASPYITRDPSEYVREMFSSLCSFLGAFAESRQWGTPDSENWDLFPESFAEFACQNSDEIDMAGYELSGEGEE